MPEHDPLVLSYVHLSRLPRADEALLTLKRVASLVKPIMRGHRWKVKELAEFYPNQQNLLGLNVNKGFKICLRLRYPTDTRQFLPIEQVVDTMLHELCHNVHGPHNQQFHALWDQLRDEHQGLLMKGYTGEGFLSEGRRLGGQARLPPQEARRLALQAAEQRQVNSQGGRRLGGIGPRPGDDIRRVIADAADRRNTTLKGCGTQRLDPSEVRAISDEVTQNGFRTQAEEDEANEVAISQALWELVQEDERAKRVEQFDETARAGVGPALPATGRHREDRASTVWVCSQCTLHNPVAHLCCNACGSERGGTSSLEARAHSHDAVRITQQKRAQHVGSAPTGETGQTLEVVDLTSSPPKSVANSGFARQGQGAGFKHQARKADSGAATTIWQCSYCGKVMERQWWTCSTCGRLKDSSR